MPAEIETPLTVHFILASGVTYRRILHDLPNQDLAADLAVGLAAATHPHGPIRTVSVASQYVQTSRRMVRELRAVGFTGSIVDLTPATIVQYWLTCDFHRERRIRVILRAFDATSGGIHPGIRAHLEGRRINKIVPSQPNRPYSGEEWLRLEKACTDGITAAHQNHRHAIDAAARGADPAIHGATSDNLAWLALRTGPDSAATILDRRGSHSDRLAAETESLRLRSALYPNADIAFAYITLFAMRTGIVPDGIDGLTVSDITHTGGASILLSYVKGRTGREALNLPHDAVRLLDRWLAHSAQLREHAGAFADHVWIHTPTRGQYKSKRPILVAPRDQYQRRVWVRAKGLFSDDGQSFAIHGGRIRATYHCRRDRSTWTGRTTIDPNHSAQVEGDHYLSSHTPAQLDAIEAVIEQAQTDLRRKAEPAVIVTSSDTADFVAAFPHLVEEAGLNADTVQALLSGEQDVFVAGCAAPLNSPHAPVGTLCPARPWVCLLCPLAAFSPRHLPNLLRLKDYFSRKAVQMTTAQFMRVFGPYAARLNEEILPRFGPTATEAAIRSVEMAAAEVPLHLEELAL